MKIDDKFTEQLAMAAAIELKPEEVSVQRDELEQMVMYVSEKLAGIDTEGFSEMVLPFDAECPLREDVVTNEDMAEEFVAEAPDSKGRYIRVPRTVEE